MNIVHSYNFLQVYDLSFDGRALLAGSGGSLAASADCLPVCPRQASQPPGKTLYLNYQRRHVCVCVCGKPSAAGCVRVRLSWLARPLASQRASQPAS